MLRHRSHTGLACGIILLGLAGADRAATASPLDAETCARLKAERTALEAAGVRQALQQTPPSRPIRQLDGKAQQIRALLDLEGQLRFRCMMDLPIASLRPDPTEEFVDAGDTAGGGRAPAVKPPVKRSKTATAKPPQTEAGDAGEATTKTAAIKTSSTEGKADAVAAPSHGRSPKAATKARSKVDDAYRAPAGSDPNGTPLDKQTSKAP